MLFFHDCYYNCSFLQIRAEKIYEDYNNFRAIIRHDGFVRWEPGGVFKTMCQIDITYYPFDEQVCELIFGAWSYHTSKMNLTSPISKINLDSYKINGEWEIMGTEAKRNEFFYECCPNERFSNVAFSVCLPKLICFLILIDNNYYVCMRPKYWKWF